MRKPAVVRFAIAALAAALLLAACSDGEPAPAAPTATPSPTPSVTRTPGLSPTAPPSPPQETPSPPELLQGDQAEFPSDMAMIIETGCWGCSGGPDIVVRVYRNPSGQVQQETLLSAERLNLPTRIRDTPEGPHEYSAFITRIGHGTFSFHHGGYLLH